LEHVVELPGIKQRKGNPEKPKQWMTVEHMYSLDLAMHIRYFTVIFAEAGHIPMIHL
jgi:hypothetical protein